MEKETKDKFLTPERVIYAVLYDLIVIGLCSTLYMGNAVYREYTRPGSAIMVGDLGGVASTAKGGR